MSWTSARKTRSMFKSTSSSIMTLTQLFPDHVHLGVSNEQTVVWRLTRLHTSRSITCGTGRYVVSMIGVTKIADYRNRSCIPSQSGLLFDICLVSFLAIYEKTNWYVYRRISSNICRNFDICESLSLMIVLYSWLPFKSRMTNMDWDWPKTRSISNNFQWTISVKIEYNEMWPNSCCLVHFILSSCYHFCRFCLFLFDHWILFSFSSSLLSFLTCWRLNGLTKVSKQCESCKILEPNLITCTNFVVTD